MKFIFIFIATMIISIPSFSEITIRKVKDRKLLVTSDFEDFVLGELFYIVDSDNMKKGVAKIMKVDGSRAIAVLGKGTAEAGYLLSKKAKTVKRKRVVTKKRVAAPVETYEPEDNWDNKVYKDDSKKTSIYTDCLLYTSPSPRDATLSRMPSSA